MSKSKIEWCDFTFNPFTGCNNNCEYCYARKIARRFCGDVRSNKNAKNQYTEKNEVYILEDQFVSNYTGETIDYPFGFELTYHKYRLGRNMLNRFKIGKRIFVGGMADMFCNWVRDEWIMDIFKECRKQPQHIYLFLTKMSKRYKEIDLLGEPNFWYGATVTSEHDIQNAFELLSATTEKMNKYLNIEPLHGAIDMTKLKVGNDENPIDWIILGAETGSRKGKIVPEREWVDNIVEHCNKESLPVFMKDSLIGIVGEENMKREYPDKMMSYLESKKITEAQRKRLFAKCNFCEVEQRKSNMVTVQARCKRGVQPKQIGFICKACADKVELMHKLKFSEVEGYDEKSKL